jgi:DnaJ-class molecular chaperone
VQRNKRGDLNIRLSLNIEEIITGCAKSKYNKNDSCKSCDGKEEVM